MVLPLLSWIKFIASSHILYIHIPPLFTTQKQTQNEEDKKREIIMCCNYGLIIPLRSDPTRFSLFSTPTFTLTLSTRPDPILILSFPTTHHHSPSLRTLFTRVGSFKPPKSSTSSSSSSSSTSTLNGDISCRADEPGSFYELLGIPETGTMLEIKQAYKQLARKYHPDVSPPGRVEEYTQRFIRVQEAYETLSDPKRRALYDMDMANGLHFAFSARRRYQTVDEQMENRSEWKSRWQSQLSELKRRSMYKESSDDMSWGARMRRQRNESSS